MSATRRELFIHFAFLIAFFIFISLIKHYTAFSFWPFWLGGIFGTLLPDIDHIIYFYFISPQDLSSKRFDFMAHKKEFGRMTDLLYETRTERKGLIFHTLFFQIIFLILTFWMLTSSASLFGRGLVLSFALHLSVDQLIDLTDLKTFDNWLRFFPMQMDFQRAQIYWVGSSVLLLIFGFLL